MTQFDAIVVGSGLAGLQAVRQLHGYRVAVVSPAPPQTGTASSRAKGGIAAPVGSDDSPELHARDTIEAGAELCDRVAVEHLVEAAEAKVRELDDLGAGFDREADGRLALGREAAHSRPRIVHAGGDRSGRAATEALAETVTSEGPEVEFLRGEVVDLCRGDGRIQGLVYRDPECRLRGLAAPAVVLATGGVGGLYRQTTNPPGLIGRGLALAYRIGAALTNLEFVQFHPTALDVPRTPRPLVTEALRGAGARLVDERGRSVVADADERGDLAPRDVVARAVFRHRQQGTRVYLDVEQVEGFAEQFPAAARMARECANGRQTSRLPVAPAAHYHMGGVATDLDGATCVDGLWACGEVAHTGVHGANRLASNSMLECLVFGERAGRSMADALSRSGEADQRAVDRVLERRADLVVDPLSKRLPDVVTRRMWRDVGIVRNKEGLAEAARMLLSVRRELSPGVPARDAALTAELIARSAWRREESRGAHFRQNHPATRQPWCGRIEVRRDDVSLGDHRVDRPAEADWRFID